MITRTQSSPPASRLRFGEFVGMMAMLTALVALSIDMVLPALPAIGSSLGVERPNDNQLVISFLFLGFGLGQLIYGPLSDNTGRKPAVYAGLSLYIAGCILALVSRNYTMMLAGRFLQGAGVAGPRPMTIALVRDKFEGRSMARVMSFIMTIFILAPVVAPTIGQGILAVSGWRTIFGVYLTLAVAACLWFGIRQEETLAADRRIPFSAARIGQAFLGVFRTRLALGYTIATGFIFGSFLGYLNSAQQILQELYGLGVRFPLYFAAIALSLGTASFLNARLVMRHGMRHLARLALRMVGLLSILFLGVATVFGGQPPLWMLMAYLLTSFFFYGLLFGNLNAMAMQPLGHIAGTGAAVVGAMSTLISLALGTVIGQSYNETILPLLLGFTILSGMGMLAMRWAEARGIGSDDDN
jgi:DHA1 family bicyclomycin/chloramphenicol resistance-like MFS transporter